MTRKFGVTISNVCASNLPKNLFAKNEYYLSFHWPNKPGITSPLCKDAIPVWHGFEFKLDYELDADLNNSEAIHSFLRNQHLVIECYTKHTLRKDSLVGSSSVNLLLLLGGPPKHQLLLKGEKNLPCGNLEFTASVKAISQAQITLQDLECHIHPDQPERNLYLQCFVSSNPHEISTPVCYHTTNPYWPTVGPFTVQGDIQIVIASVLTVRLLSVTSEETTQVAYSDISLRKYNTATEELIFFREDLCQVEEHTIKSVGIVEGYISFSQLPVPCQMWEGIHKNGKIFEAAPLLLGLYNFPEINVSQKPPVYDPYDPSSVKASPYEFSDIDVNCCKIREIIELINSSENLLFPLENLSKYLSEPVAREAFYREKGTTVIMCLLQNEMEQYTHSSRNFFQKTQVSELLPIIVEIIYKASLNCTKTQAYYCRESLISNILRVLVCCFDSESVLRNTVRMLFMIANRDGEGQETVIRSGGIPAVARVFLHSENEELTLECTKLFRALTFQIIPKSCPIVTTIRNTGVVRRLSRLIYQKDPLGAEVLQTLRDLSFDNLDLQAELLELILPMITKISNQSFPETQLARIFELLSSWINQSTSSLQIVLSEEQLQFWCSLLVSKQYPGCKSQVLEILLSLLTHEDNQIALANHFLLHQFVSASDTITGLQVLESITIPAHQILLNNNLETLLALHQKSPIEMRMTINRIFERFLQSEPNHVIIFSQLFEFLTNSDIHRILEGSVILRDLLGLFPVQQCAADSILADYTFKLGDIVLNRYSSNTENESESEISSIILRVSRECLLIIMRNSGCFQMFFPTLVPKLYVVNHLTCEIFSLLAAITKSNSNNPTIAIEILELFDSPALRTLAGSEYWISGVSSQLLGICQTLGSNQIQFRKQLIQCIRIYLQTSPNVETEQRLHHFALLILDGFTSDNNLSFGIDVATTQTILSSLLVDLQQDSSYETFSRNLLRKCILRFEDFRKISLDFLLSQLKSQSCSITVQLEVLQIIQSVSESVPVDQSFLGFCKSLVEWIASPNAPPKELYENLLMTIQILFRTPESWELIIPTIRRVLVSNSQSHSIELFIQLLFRIAENPENSNSPGFLNSYSKHLLEFLEPPTLFNLLSPPGQDSDPLLCESIRKLLELTLQHVSVLEHCPMYPYQGLDPYLTILTPYIEIIKCGNPLSSAHLTSVSVIFKMISKLKHISLNSLTLKVLLEYINASINYFLPSKPNANLGYLSLSLLAAANVVRHVPDILYNLNDHFFDIPNLVELYDVNDSYLTASLTKLMRILFFDPRFQNSFSENDGFFKIAKTLETLCPTLSSSDESRKAIEEIVHFLVAAAQVPNLRLEIVGDGLIPLILNMLNITRLEEILLPVLACIYFLSLEPVARLELIDTRDIDTLSTIIDQRAKYPKLSVAAEECFVRLGGITLLCLAAAVPAPSSRDWFKCKTCGLNEVCGHCAKICHKGHGLIPTLPQTALCGCGSSSHCLIKERPTLRVQIPLRLCSFQFSKQNYTEQSWFYCRTCFRNEQKGICTICAQFCHAGHDLQYGSDSKFYCDCNDRYGGNCKCSQHIVAPPDSLARKRKPRKKSDQDNSQPENLPDDIDDHEDDDSCIVCMDRPKEALFFKCGHIAACMECACLLKQRKEPCLICRESIAEVVRVYRV